jgi:hypothetical protein
MREDQYKAAPPNAMIPHPLRMSVPPPPMCGEGVSSSSATCANACIRSPHHRVRATPPERSTGFPCLITAFPTTLRSGRTVAYWTFVHMARKGSSMTWRPEGRNASMLKCRRQQLAMSYSLSLVNSGTCSRLGNRRSRRPSCGAFLQGIRVGKTTRQAVLRWYRLPRPSFLKMVELRGLEPLTPRLPALCSPN